MISTFKLNNLNTDHLEVQTDYEEFVLREMELEREAFPKVELSFWCKLANMRIRMEALAERLRLNKHPMNYNRVDISFADVDFY